MALLSRAQILEVNDLTTEDVEVPEWGGTVRVKTLRGRERDEFEKSTVIRKGNNVRQNMDNFRAKLIALCAVDEDGVALFASRDVHGLGLKSAAALERVFEVCTRLNGMTKKDIEDLTEDFGDGPNESSTTD